MSTVSHTFIRNGLAMPPHLQASLEAYTNEGRPTGDFLRACLCNDLINAAFRADEMNRILLQVIALYIAHNVPADIRGSEAAVDAWVAKKAEERHLQRYCKHERLNEEGICRACGEDRRGI